MTASAGRGSLWNNRLVRYFTRGLVDGELSDQERDQAGLAYARRLEAILPGLPDAVRDLAGLNLHDAQIETAQWQPAERRLTLSLVTRRAQRWHTVTLVYSGALLGEQRVQTLRDAARDRQTQVIADEIDQDEQGILSHRLLFWPRDEMTIDFTALELKAAERPDGRVSLIPHYLELVADDDE